MNLKHSSMFAVSAAVMVLAAARPAEAKHVRFLGPHPIAAKYGGGYCYIEAPHVHIYAPDSPTLYHESDGEYDFVGDPTPFGYDGPKFTFYGHHPVPGLPSVFCYLDGPHSHEYPPPRSPEYRVEGGAAFYVGAFDPVYFRDKPHRWKAWQAEYRPYTPMRPTVTVAPPPEWHGEVWVPAPPDVVINAPSPPGVYVNAPSPPGVYVNVPSPTVQVNIPRPPRVEVSVPAPPGIFFGVPGPRPIIVRERYREREREHDDDDEWHHDNGKHKGWDKHGEHHGKDHDD